MKGGEVVLGRGDSEWASGVQPRMEECDVGMTIECHVVNMKREILEGKDHVSGVGGWWGHMI